MKLGSEILAVLRQQWTITHEYVCSQTITYNRNTVEELLVEEAEKKNKSGTGDGNIGFKFGGFSAKISDEYTKDSNINTVLEDLSRTKNDNETKRTETVTEI
ncbi:hypothetical protein H0H92_008357, partial [Tricholoma furcatifolium]